jgi:hypothetical protein
MSYLDENKLILLKKANEKLRLSDDINIEKNKNLVFVYTPPKVGSTTLITTFRICANKKCTILHIHNEKMLEILCGIKNITINEIIHYNASLGKNVYVIDVYRTPIEWKISMFFERICDYHFSNSAENLNTYDINKIVTRFNNIFKYLCNDDYFKDVYSISEIIPSEFSFDKKYLLIEKDCIKYIKLRLCDSENWEKIIKEIMDTEVKIIKDYETENKNISELYKKFKSVYCIPENRLKEIEESSSFQYYNSCEERNSYIKTWKEKMTTSVEGYNIDEYEFYKKLCSENKWIPSVQLHHYIDEGCECSLCAKRRDIVLEGLKNGNIVKPNKIEHEKIVKVQQNIDIVNKIKKLSILKQIVERNLSQAAKKQRLSANIVKGNFKSF